MVREQLRLRSHHLRKTFVQHLHDPAMQLLPLTAQQRAVRCVLHQRMLEGVDRAALEDQPRNDETLQPTLHLCISPLRNGSEEVIRELPPDGCADLCNLPRGGAEPAEPGHQRRVQAGGDRQSCQWNRRGGPLHVGLALRLQHRFRHFLHEQWDTVSALKNVLANACGQRLISNNAVDHPAGITLRQPVDVEACDVRPSDPSSGRNVTISSTRRVRILSTVRPNSSRLVRNLCEMSVLFGIYPLMRGRSVDPVFGD